MKKFYYDTLLDPENICNLIKERDLIEKAVRKSAKIVVYGRRNFGKTSLVKNVVLPNFASKNKKHFIFFADLMDVKSMDSIDQRILKGFELGFSSAFPARDFMEMVKRFLSSLRPQVVFDANTGSPSLSIAAHHGEKKLSCDEIFKTILNIAGERQTIIVLDEFQDVAFVDEAQGMFRRIFQEIRDLPVIVMGSKRHLLADILAKPNAPLSMFGEDIEFGPIPYEEYHEYILERFGDANLSVSLEDSTYLQNAVLRVPETINIVCAEIADSNKDCAIGRKEIDVAIYNAVAKRQSRYEEYLSHFSENEESVIISIAKRDAVIHPNSRDFLATVKPTSRMVGLIVRNLLGKSVLDKDKGGYFVSDPLLAFYLKKYR